MLIDRFNKIMGILRGGRTLLPKPLIFTMKMDQYQSVPKKDLVNIMMPFGNAARFYVYDDRTLGKMYRIKEDGDLEEITVEEESI